MPSAPAAQWQADARAALAALRLRALAAAAAAADGAARGLWFGAQAASLGAVAAALALCLFAVLYAALVPVAVRELPLAFESAVSAARARGGAGAWPPPAAAAVAASAAPLLTWRDFAAVADTGDVALGGGQEFAVQLSLTLLEDALLPRGGAGGGAQPYASLQATVDLLADDASGDGSAACTGDAGGGTCASPAGAAVVATCRRRVVVVRRGTLARLWAGCSERLAALAAAWAGLGASAQAEAGLLGASLVHVDVPCFRAFANAAAPAQQVRRARVTLQPSWFPEAGAPVGAPAGPAGANAPAPANAADAAVLGSLRFYARMRGAAYLLYTWFWTALAVIGGGLATLIFAAGVGASVAARAYAGADPGVGIPFPAAFAEAIQAALAPPPPPTRRVAAPGTDDREPEPHLDTPLPPLPIEDLTVAAAAAAARLHVG